MDRRLVICAGHPMSLEPMPDPCSPAAGMIPHIVVEVGSVRQTLEQAGWLYVKNDIRFVMEPGWICPACAERYWRGPLKARAIHDFKPETWYGIKFVDLGTGRLLCRIHGRNHLIGYSYFELSDCFRPVKEGYRDNLDPELKTKTWIDYQERYEVSVGRILDMLNIRVVEY